MVETSPQKTLQFPHAVSLSFYVVYMHSSPCISTTQTGEMGNTGASRPTLHLPKGLRRAHQTESHITHQSTAKNTRCCLPLKRIGLVPFSLLTLPYRAAYKANPPATPPDRHQWRKGRSQGRLLAPPLADRSDPPAGGTLCLSSSLIGGEEEELVSLQVFEKISCWVALRLLLLACCFRGLAHNSAKPTKRRAAAGTSVGITKASPYSVGLTCHQNGRQGGVYPIILCP